MSKDIFSLIGSFARDGYRYEHKQLKNYSSKDAHKKCKACDIDLIEIRNGRITAFTDFKLPKDKISWAEEIAYSELSQLAPVFIVTSEDSNLEGFKVESYPKGKFYREYNSKKDFFRYFIEIIDQIALSMGYEEIPQEILEEVVS